MPVAFVIILIVGAGAALGLPGIVIALLATLVLAVFFANGE